MIGREEAATGLVVLILLVLMGAALIFGLITLSQDSDNESERWDRELEEARSAAESAGTDKSSGFPDAKTLIVWGACLGIIAVPFIALYMTRK